MDDPGTTLSNKTFCAVGRFAAMSQKEFRRCLTELGCRCVTLPRPDTDYVVVGDEGCAETSKALREAWDLRKSGLPLEIISESDFYCLAGQFDSETEVLRRLTLAELAKTLKIPGAKLRQWVRWGLLQPAEVIHRLEFFRFAAISTTKRLLQWTEGGLTITQIRRELASLRERLPRPFLSDADVIQRHGRLLIRHQGQLLDSGGQHYFDFSDENDSPPSVKIPPAPADLGELFEQALLAESCGRWREAIEFYQKALHLEPDNPILYFNLGNTYYGQGRLENALDCFQRALNLDEGYAEAWNNLGNIHLELEQWREAIEAFGRALQLVSNYQDARQNLNLALSLLADRRRTKLYT